MYVLTYDKSITRVEFMPTMTQNENTKAYLLITKFRNPNK